MRILARFGVLKAREAIGCLFGIVQSYALAAPENARKRETTEDRSVY